MLHNVYFGEQHLHTQASPDAFDRPIASQHPNDSNATIAHFVSVFIAHSNRSEHRIEMYFTKGIAILFHFPDLGCQPLASQRIDTFNPFKRPFDGFARQRLSQHKLLHMFGVPQISRTSGTVLPSGNGQSADSQKDAYKQLRVGSDWHSKVLEK